MLKKYINSTLRLTLVVFLFLSVFLVKPEFFNGIVTGKQYGLELAVAFVAGYLIFFLPFRKSIRVTRVDTGIIILCFWYLLVIPAARSRAAWVAGLAGCVYVLWKHPGIADYRAKVTGLLKRMSFFLRLTVIALAFILLLPAGMGLYLMKQGSASGRVLMWKVTWEVVKEKPLFGHGTGSFNALYMPAQARWFESGKGNDVQVMVAGSPQAPFNEPLGLWLEKGMVGILLAGGILFLIFYPGTARSGPGKKFPADSKDKQNSSQQRSHNLHLITVNFRG